MSAGSGYLYLLRSVVAGDGNRGLSTPLTRYYAEVGTPPGRWMGSGLAAFGDGQLKPGMRVTEDQLALLIGMGRDPVTGDLLGRAFPAYQRLADRMGERVAALDPDMMAEDRAAEIGRIEAEETVVGRRRAVAGFDLTFSVPKSVSVLWGVADAVTQERIVAAHHGAVADVVAFFEREVAATRAGFSDRDGAVAQVGVIGVAAAAYDHFDSRAGDPQLHTHVVVSNKVQAVLDGRWRSLDGRPVFASRVGLSEHYNAVLADRLARDVGIGWEQRERGPDRNPRWEIVGVTDELITEFSGRTHQIEQKKNALIADYVARHGRQPSAKVIVELRAQATLATRPPKQVRSLADLTEGWRQRAAERLGGDPTAWATTLFGRGGTPRLVDEVPREVIEAIAADVVAAVGVKRSVWNHWNLMAEASKQTMGLRFATTTDREAAIAQIVEAAQARSVALTPPELTSSPERFRRENGTSVFRPKRSTKYSSMTVLDAEERLLARSDPASGPVVRPAVTSRVLASMSGSLGGGLSVQQRTAIESITTSGRVLDLLVGPAGAGKTTTMRALRKTWIAEHGPGSVIGLAPAAAAAAALADDLGVACDNTAKWLTEHDLGRTGITRNQLVILDEATLASTRTLDRIMSIAERAGAKVLLVGDPHQLQPVEAGGAFSLLVDRRTDAPELTEIHRFIHAWEKHATLALRRGEVEVIATYARQDRIREGDTDEMLDRAYEAWRADIRSGRTSVLVADSTAAVRSLNERARAERLLLDGVAGTSEVALGDGGRASVGDVVITRRNNRTLRTAGGEGGAAGEGWVKNGDRWRVTDIRRNGTVVVERLDPTHQSKNRPRRRPHKRPQQRAQNPRQQTVLPPEYVGEHLELGYAVTAHRAQGVTVDTSHVVVTSSTTRENFYVAMSRGRGSNIAYVALDQPDDIHLTPEPDDVTAYTVLTGVLRHSGATLGALQTMEAEYELYGGIDRLAAELETIAADAHRDRYIALLALSGLTAEQHTAVVISPAFGPLTAALRRAEAHHHDVDELIPTIVGQHGLTDSHDIAAVLERRLQRRLRHAAESATTGSTLRSRLIAGLIPYPLGAMSVEHRRAIDERAKLIEARAHALATTAIETGAAWTRRLGTSPPNPMDHAAWMLALTTIAAYRDRYQIESDLPAGACSSGEVQAVDRTRAQQAARLVGRLSATSEGANATRCLSSVQQPVPPHRAT